MVLNRIIDRDIDAENPRTASGTFRRDNIDTIVLGSRGIVPWYATLFCMDAE